MVLTSSALYGVLSLSSQCEENQLSYSIAGRSPIYHETHLGGLYHGNLTVSGQTFQRGTKYARALNRVTEMEDALGQKLTTEDRPLLAEYAMASAGLTSVSLEEAYIEGFRTGAQIMLAVLEANEAPESENEKA